MGNYQLYIMKRLLFTFTFFCLLVVGGHAQKVLTLKECLEIGIKNNLSLESKRNEIQKGKYGISENRARLLPQINGFANYNDNFVHRYPLPMVQHMVILTTLLIPCSTMPTSGCNYKCRFTTRHSTPLCPLPKQWTN